MSCDSCGDSVEDAGSIFPETFEEPRNKRERTSPWLTIGFIIFAILIMSSCASNLTPEEIEWREGIDKENWSLCERMSASTTHVGHEHRKHRRLSHMDIRDDLSRNSCRMLLGEEWAEYHYDK